MWLRLVSVFLVASYVFAQGNDTITSLTVSTQLNNITLELISGKAEDNGNDVLDIIVANYSTQLDQPQINYDFHPDTPYGVYHARMNGTIYNGATSLSRKISTLSNSFTLTTILHNCGTSTPVRSLTDPAYSPLRLTVGSGNGLVAQADLSGPTGGISINVARVDARFDSGFLQTTMEILNTVTGFSSGVHKQVRII
ncbi:hypothetical protein B0H19DRAFT_1267720 [Mycena capillaripes]|nr:hypothetical protein B0H19DRAFT_1267720 [Mycena capillaripes]